MLGLPFSTLVGERFGWRAAFWAITVITVAAAAATLLGVPRSVGTGSSVGFREEAAAFRRPGLWRALSTSTLIIGATFSAFSYLNPILTGVTGFAPGTVPLLLIAYEAATVVGNNVVGRFADGRTTAVLAVGLALNTAFLAGFALLADPARPGRRLHDGHRPGRRDHEPDHGDPCPAHRRCRTAGQHRAHLLHHPRRHPRVRCRRRRDRCLVRCGSGRAWPCSVSPPSPPT
ncbi:MFS transporter [Streptomyces sp. NPDC059989]|uniref:MFS transporter n=1 Tax=Streptomyces sp. NPDC059989 TaxID=3347026 RepID=UPI0036BC6FCB